MHFAVYAHASLSYSNRPFLSVQRSLCHTAVKSVCLSVQAAELLGHKPQVAVLPVEADEPHVAAAKNAVKQPRQAFPAVDSSSRAAQKCLSQYTTSEPPFATMFCTILLLAEQHVDIL